MGNIGKVIQPILGAGETALGVATVNPALIASGAGTLGTGIASDLAGSPKLPSLSPTMPVGAQSTPNLSSLFGGGGGGLSGSLTSSIGAGAQGGGGGGTSFGGTGGGGGGDLLSMILQLISGGGQ